MSKKVFIDDKYPEDGLYALLDKKQLGEYEAYKKHIRPL